MTKQDWHLYQQYERVNPTVRQLIIEYKTKHYFYYGRCDWGSFCACNYVLFLPWGKEKKELKNKKRKTNRSYLYLSTNTASCSFKCMFRSLESNKDDYVKKKSTLILIDNNNQNKYFSIYHWLTSRFRKSNTDYL